MRKKPLAFVAALVCMNMTGAMASTVAEIKGARDKAVAWLIQTQQPDGRWVSAAGLDVHTTSVAVDALIDAGMMRSASVASAVSWLLNAPEGGVDAMARQSLVLNRIGAARAKSLAVALMSRRNTIDQAWGAYASYAGSLPDTPLALRATNLAPQVLSPELKGQITTALMTAQKSSSSNTYGPTGYWTDQLNSSFSGTPTSTANEILISTSETAVALNELAIGAEHVTKALNFLRGRQVLTGVFTGAFSSPGTGNSTPNCLPTAMVVKALININPVLTEPSVSLATSHLLANCVQSEGDFGDAFTTANVVSVLSKQLGSGTNSDNDGDGVPDGVEAHLATDQASVDAKSIALENQASRGQVATPDRSENIRLSGIIGVPFSYSHEVLGLASCCDLRMGGLSPGLEISSGQSKINIFGVPYDSGASDAVYRYMLAGGESGELLLSFDMVESLFSVQTDPVDFAPYLLSPPDSNIRQGFKMALVDLNSDGLDDLVVYVNGASESTAASGLSGAEHGKLLIFKQVDGRYEKESGVDAEISLIGDVKSMSVIDHDGDGKKDLILNMTRVGDVGLIPSVIQAMGLPDFSSLVVLKNVSGAGGLIGLSNVTVSGGFAVSQDGGLVILNAPAHDRYVYAMVSAGNAPLLVAYDPMMSRYRSTGGFGRPSAFNAAFSIDYDRDGVLDLGYFDSNGGLVFLRTLSGAAGGASLVLPYSTATVSIDRKINKIQVSDLSGDGLDDIVLYEQIPAGGKVSLLKATGVNNIQQPGYSLAPLVGVPEPFLGINNGGEAVDLNNDGTIDLFLTGYDGNSDAMENSAYIQNSDGAFAHVKPALVGTALGEKSGGHPLFIDLNGDGALDLAWPNGGLKNYWYTNNLTNNGSLYVELRSGQPDVADVGAIIEVDVAGKKQTRTLKPLPGRSLGEHFGIGSATSAKIHVKWPDGSQKHMDITRVNRRVVIEKN